MNNGVHNSDHDFPAFELGGTEMLAKKKKRTDLKNLTYDFVVRSLRRRLWKAFLDEDSVTALRSYQATLTDFIRWLEDEEEEEEEARLAALKAATKQRRNDGEEEYLQNVLNSADQNKQQERQKNHRKSSSSISKKKSFSSLFSNRRTSRKISSSSDHHRSSSSNNSSNANGSKNIAKSKKERKGKSSMTEAVDDDVNDDDRERRLRRQQQQQKQREKEMELEQQKKREEEKRKRKENLQILEGLFDGSNAPILQSRMRPSDYFIADDFLSPYDYSTYDREAVKEIPVLIPTSIPNDTDEQRQQQQLQNDESEEEQNRRRRRERRRERRRRHRRSTQVQPRIAYRRRIYLGSRRLSREDEEEIDNNDFDDDNDNNYGDDNDGDEFQLVNSLVSDSVNDTANRSKNDDDRNNSNNNIYSTTPLHEAARLGFGDFVRILLADGGVDGGRGDVNVRNGSNRTALHMCAGGYTEEEEQLRIYNNSDDDTRNDDDRIGTIADESFNSPNTATIIISTPNATVTATTKNKKDKKRNKKRKSKKLESNSIDLLLEADLNGGDGGDNKNPPLYQNGGNDETKTNSATTATGIRTAFIPEEILKMIRRDPEEEEEEAAAAKSRKKTMDRFNGRRGSLKFIGRMFHKGKNKTGINDKRSNIDDDDHDDTNDVEIESKQQQQQQQQTITHRPADPTKRLNEIVMGRMDAMMALLSWINSDDENGEEGPSVNAVDFDGRTALHYAAELGRTDLCLAILSNFGVILTVVDETSRTPCEVAALNGHDSLAAQLEARALLYLDPYGLDDEMMDSMVMMPGAAENHLAAPFCWFQTSSKDEVVWLERTKRLDEIRDQFIDINSNNNHIDDHYIKENDQQSSIMVQSTIVTTSFAETGGGQNNNRNNDDDSWWPTDLRPYNNRDVVSSCKITTKVGDHHPYYYSDKILRFDLLPSYVDCGENTIYVPEDHLERFVASHKWNIPTAIEAFRKDPKNSLKAAGIVPLFTLYDDVPLNNNNSEKESSDNRTCSICYDDDVSEEDWMQLKNCGHGFCEDCLLDYIKECATNRMPLHTIDCPDHECESGFSFKDIQSLLLSPKNKTDEETMMNRMKEASTDYFISSSSDFKFCPHPGCDGVVHRLNQPSWERSGFDQSIFDYTGAVCTFVPGQRNEKKIGDGDGDCTFTYEGVEDPDYNNCRCPKRPPKAHRFCFSCLESVHWPLTCEAFKEWKDKIAEEIDDVDKAGVGGDGESFNSDDDFNELAQKMWLKANTRPCPECNVPIEKNDGCNHMICNVCRHEFCWVCRKDWKKHTIRSSDGYFTCTLWEKDDKGMAREEGASTDDDGSNNNSNNLTNGLNDDDDRYGFGTSVYTARQAWIRKQEMKKFLHHYAKYVAHEESSILEQRMSKSVCARMAQMVLAAIDFDGSPSFNFGGRGLSFVHNAFFELSECRSVLRHSYAFSYFRYPLLNTSGNVNKASSSIVYHQSKRREKLKFERMQVELELITEQMSDIVARSHLRANQTQIMYLTAGAAEKRVDFTNYVLQIYREEKKEIQKRKERRKLYEDEEREKKQNNNYNRSSSSISTSNEQHNNNSIHREEGYALGGGGDLIDSLISAMTESRRTPMQQRNGVVSLFSGAHPFVADVDNIIDTGTSDDAIPEIMWSCTRCTFMNTGGIRCSMCDSPNHVI